MKTAQFKATDAIIRGIICNVRKEMNVVELPPAISHEDVYQQAWTNYLNAVDICPDGDEHEHFGCCKNWLKHWFRREMSRATKEENLNEQIVGKWFSVNPIKLCRSIPAKFVDLRKIVYKKANRFSLNNKESSILYRSMAILQKVWLSYYQQLEP